MIRLEIKISIPDSRKKEDFLKVLQENAKNSDSSLWQTNFDIIEGQRAALQAVLGTEGLPYFEYQKILIITCDFATKKQAHKVYNLFKKMAISWEMEINGLVGKRIFSDLLDIDLEE